MWRMAAISVGAMLAGGGGPRGSTAAARTAETTSAALDVLRKAISVDVHTHGGKTGITSKAPPSDDLANRMRAGSLAVACLADVPDGPILAGTREAPLPRSACRSRASFTTIISNASPGWTRWSPTMACAEPFARPISRAAHEAGQPAIVGDVEGLDFLDGKLERLEEAHQRGIRHLQLVHYTPNDIGDFQTGAITHQGLTEFRRRGRSAPVIGSGFVCDVAHATEDTVKQAVKVATKPLLLSHTALSGSRAMGPTPLAGRQVTPDHARAIAETGGSIGIWHFFPSLDRYVDGLKEMAKSSGSITSASAPTSRSPPGSRAGLCAMGAARRGDAARRLHRRGRQQDRRRQLYADLPRRGRLTLTAEGGRSSRSPRLPQPRSRPREK